MSFLIKYDQPQEASVINIQSDEENVTSEHSAVAVPVTSSSVIKFYPEWCCGCLVKGHNTLNTTPVPADATFLDRASYWFQCPPFGPVARIMTFLIMFILAWTMIYFLLGDVASFHGPIFSLVVLEICGLFFGILVKCVGFPALLAPLTIGIILRNIQPLDIFKAFEFPYNEEGYCEKLNINDTKCCNQFKLEAASAWIGPLRQIALALILTRAGLELSPKKLLKLKLVVPLLAFAPCVVEAFSVAGLFYAFFSKLNPNPFMLFVSGFALSAVSPAVVVPGMMSLAAKGYGVGKGIPTLLVAASSIDDVLAITCFTIFLKLGIKGLDDSVDTHKCDNSHHAENHAIWLISAGPCIGIVIGLFHGLLVGIILHFFPSADSKNKGILRLCLLTITNLVSIFGYGRTEVFETAGSIGVLVTSFVAGFGWRSLPHWKPAFHDVEHILKHIWTLYVPILFGTIGKEIKFTVEHPDPYEVAEDSPNYNKAWHEEFWNPFSLVNIGKIIGIVLIALIIRMLVVLAIAKFIAKFKNEECLFMGLAWVPKATVQAALAPLVLTEVLKREHTTQMMCIAKLIVTMSVMGILITAPIGAICIALTGPRLLSKPTEEEVKEIEEEFPNGDPEPEDIEPHHSVLSISSTAYSSDVFYSADHRRSGGSTGRNGRYKSGGSLTLINQRASAEVQIQNRGSQSLTTVQEKGEGPKPK